MTTAPRIQTVTGPVDPADLGTTLVHEHVLIDMYEVSLNSLLILSDEAVARDELKVFQEAGGQTIVDQTVIGLNPEPDALRRISVATGVHIIAGTGVYWRRFRPSWVDAMSVDELAARFTADLTVGMGATQVRAGIIGEIATGHRDIDDVEKRVLHAAAIAQHRTGVPIATHAIYGRIGLMQLDLLSTAGADLAKVAIGHGDTNQDPGYHDEVLARGAWLAFDTTGQLDKVTDEWRADRIVELSGAGHLGRLLVSSDVCKRPALARNGGGGYAHVLRTLVPLLMHRGFTDADVRSLLRDNPRRFLTPTPSERLPGS
jgi:phosphotriesterase-related protein